MKTIYQLREEYDNNGSNCCGAKVFCEDICSDCKEHCESLEDYVTSYLDYVEAK